MPKYVDTIQVQIGGRDIDDVINKITVRSTRATKAVVTLSRSKRARGFKRGAVLYELTAQVEDVDDSNPAYPDWHALQEAGEEFTIVIKKNTGKPITFKGVTVTDVDDDATDGDSGGTVKMLALERLKS